MEDSNQEEKQNYLRENILNRGYDANIFINFLKTKKGEQGADISNWSLPDLQEVVQEFISLNTINYIPNQFNMQSQPDENNQINPHIDQTNPEINQINPQINQINEQNNEVHNNSNANIGSLKDEDFGIIIPDIKECRKSEITELFNYKNIEITVSDPKKVDKGFFS